MSRKILGPDKDEYRVGGSCDMDGGMEMETSPDADAGKVSLAGWDAWILLHKSKVFKDPSLDGMSVTEAIDGGTTGTIGGSKPFICEVEAGTPASAGGGKMPCKCGETPGSSCTSMEVETSVPGWSLVTISMIS